MERQSQIAKLNDQFRKGDDSLGLWVTTDGVNALAYPLKQGLIQVAQAYEDFTEDNDPYSEHDFGTLRWEGVEYFWEIVCYDKDSQRLSVHPEDGKATIRVLTVMRADEYYDVTVSAPSVQRVML